MEQPSLQSSLVALLSALGSASLSEKYSARHELFELRKQLSRELLFSGVRVVLSRPSSGDHSRSLK